jgi:nitrite reductase/ring-hydroxylating ferredoxin subunit
MSETALRSAWHAVAAAESLKDWPFGTSVLDEPVVIARMNGGIAALRDVCAHMDAALSGGWIMRGAEGEELVCPNHRWRYNAGGRCTHIPELGEQQVIPDWTRVPAYATREHYGALWVCLDADAPAELPRLPALENPRYARPAILTRAWKLPAQTVMDQFAVMASATIGPGALTRFASPLCAAWVTRNAERAVLFTVTPLTRKASRGFWIAAVQTEAGADADIETVNAQAFDALCQTIVA